MDEKRKQAPSFKTKLFFWLALTFLSVYFAEVPSGSQPYAFFTPWLIMLVIVYGLHILVLSSIAFKGGLSFHILFLAGCIFGMYEAYLTKVLFDPPWGRSFLHFFGFYILFILVLVPFWHTIFSFIIPLVVAERYLTKSNIVFSALPNRIRRILSNEKSMKVFLAIAIVWAALFMGGNQPVFFFAPISLLINLIPVAFIICLFRKKVGKVHSIRSLLPNRKQTLVLIVPLGLVYLVMGIFTLPERLPRTTYSQLLILALYLIFFILLHLHMKKSRNVRISKSPRMVNTVPWKYALILFLVFSLVAIPVGLSGIGFVFMMLTFLFSSIMSIILFGKNLLALR